MKFLILVALFASACAGVIEQQQYGAPAVVAAPAAVATEVQGPPKHYSQSISAAAIRNVETVGVTKTITPVVTKTTTHHTHSEPAISVGHVQGYTQSSVGSPQVIPVQYNTQYTSYQNPTVGVNGPVSYAGPAVSTGLPVAAAVAQPVYAQQAAYVQQAAVAQPAYLQQQAYAAAPAVAAVAQPAVYQQAAYAPALTHAYNINGGVYAQQATGLYSVQPSIQALNYAQPQFFAAPAHAQVAQVGHAQGVAYSKY